MIPVDPTATAGDGVGIASPASRPSRAEPTASEASEAVLSETDRTAEELAVPTPEAEASEAALPLPIPIPYKPILLKRAVSGRYRSSGGFWQLELRVDVDGSRPMKKVSGDFFQAVGATVVHFGSFVVSSPTVTVTASTVTIEGMGSYTWAAGAPKVKVTVPRTGPWQPAAAATIQFFTLSNQPGAAYVCPFQSTRFRTVQYEQDCVQGVSPFVSYNTGSFPSGGPARTLSVPGAYAEAGIELQTAGVPNVVPTADAGANSKWSNAELHNAMVKHFSLWLDVPQWRVWLLAAQLHENGSGLYGIMFDQQGKQRQGCAVFHAGIGGATADKLRLQLYTYVHELGHCFNLLHSWQKSYAVPPVPNRPAALSWMNYPWYFAGGASAFWSAFPFQFDDPEVVHLRHAFRNHVVMGANPFTVGSGLEDGSAFADPVEDYTGLKLEIQPAKRTVRLGEPVVLELALRLTDLRGKTAHADLHPNYGFVQVGILTPGGRVLTYKPMMEHCKVPQEVRLDESSPAVFDSAYLGYGKDGLYFDQVGTYRIRAVYYASDGSPVVSNVAALRVRAPVTSNEDEIAELFLGDEQGTLLYLLGSSSDELRRGNAAFDEVIEKHGKDPMAMYARLVKGINASRRFKHITSDNRLASHEPRMEESAKLLGAVLDASEKGAGVDTVTLGQVTEKLALAELERAGDKEAAAVARKMVEIVKKRGARADMIAQIERKADSILGEMKKG